MNANEVVVHEVLRDRVGTSLDLFEKPLVRRVERRICIRIVRFWRSANDVLTCLGSGLPSTFCLRDPML